jgi:hypothetical protein
MRHGQAAFRAAAASSAPSDAGAGSTAARRCGEHSNEAPAAMMQATKANQNATASPSENGPEIRCGKKLRPVR